MMMAIFPSSSSSRLRHSLLLPLQRRCSSSSDAFSAPPPKSWFAWYARKLDSHPLLTRGITSGLITGTGDVICQFLSSKPDNDEEQSGMDWFRTGRFFLMGAFWVAPVTHFWYGALSTRLLPGPSTVWRVTQRVVVDQFGFAPIFLPTFVTGLWLLEGTKTHADIRAQLGEVVPEMIVAGWSLWIPAMTVNFGFVPLKYQVLFGNVVALLWNVYVSYMSAGGGGGAEKKNTTEVISDTTAP